MKYDRPVWQIMHACADAMPEVFRYDDVRQWFDENYPDVNEATIRAHLIGLTEGGRAKHVQFAQRSPVFRRVARGEYTPIPVPERGETPETVAAEPTSATTHGVADEQETGADPVATPVEEPRRLPAPRVMFSRAADGVPEPDDETATPDVILLGGIGERVNVPAPAREVCREVAFQLSRLDAERSGAAWFVLSSEHGLLAPDEWQSPDSRTMAELDPGYRAAWAAWVVARLQSVVGDLDGKLVRVDAPDEFVGPLSSDLQDAGAVVSTGSVALMVPIETEPPTPRTQEKVSTGEKALEVASAPRPTTAAQPSAPSAEVTRFFRSRPTLVSAADVSQLPESPGLYAWYVDPIGARDLNRCLMLPVRSGLIFVGQVGGSSWQSLADPILNLRDHVERIQLGGRARASTFRMTLAVVLRDHLRMTSLDDSRLTDWMTSHLSIAVWPSDELGRLRELEQRVAVELDPPLNVDHLPANDYRERLSQMRSAMG